MNDTATFLDLELVDELTPEQKKMLAAVLSGGSEITTEDISRAITDFEAVLDVLRELQVDMVNEGESGSRVVYRGLSWL